uniref:Transposase n=1 Tax=Heligmosomoides polygyrus TaxID=6339 RepID=A0A183GUP7_HELPZ
LLCAKYRLAPISYLTGKKKATIPKLVLLALLIGSQLTDYLLCELDIAIEKISRYKIMNGGQDHLSSVDPRNYGRSNTLK